MIDIDWNATIAWIAFGVAIITPCITTYLNNRFQLKLKKLELEQIENSSSYEAKYKAYSEYIKLTSNYIIDNAYLEDHTKYTKAYHELLLHVPPSIWSTLESIDNKFSNRSFDEEAKAMLLNIAKQLSDELGKSKPKSIL